MIELGDRLVEGRGITGDAAAGCDWYEKAAAADDAHATNNLGICFGYGRGRSRNPERALALFDKAGNLGNTMGLVNLGDMHFAGRGVPADLNKANALYRQAAEAGNSAGMVELANSLLHGFGIVRDGKEACAWYEKAALLGHTGGATGLAHCYEHGLGRRANTTTARKHYLQAAEAGNLVAMRNVARLADEGIGGKRDTKEAALWLRNALATGDSTTASDLISGFGLWHQGTRRELQRLLKEEGRYAGAEDGQPSVELDEVLWTGAAKVSHSPDHLEQQFARVPISGSAHGILVRICRKPQDDSKRPLAIINHGLTTVAATRHQMRPKACGLLAEQFTELGYVVAFPLRRGYGETGGAFRESNKHNCRSADYVAPGQAIAEDILAVARHLVATRDDIAAEKTVVIGHSGGGWGTLALASRNPDGIRAYVNFSGGHGSRKGTPDAHCGHEPLARGAKRFGATSRRPMLWIYVENDTHIGPALARRMHKDFTRAGGQAHLEILPAFGNEGHELFTDGGAAIWRPVIADWLTRLPDR